MADNAITVQATDVSSSQDWTTDPDMISVKVDMDFLQKAEKCIAFMRDNDIHVMTNWWAFGYALYARADCDDGAVPSLIGDDGEAYVDFDPGYSLDGCHAKIYKDGDIFAVLPFKHSAGELSCSLGNVADLNLRLAALFPVVVPPAAPLPISEDRIIDFMVSRIAKGDMAFEDIPARLARYGLMHPDDFVAEMSERMFDAVPSNARARPPGAPQYTIEQIARTGTVVVHHDSSRCLHDSNAYEVTVRGSRGELLIGTYVHDSEMNDLVGPVVADSLRDAVSRGRYVIALRPAEILGLRGTLEKRVHACDWSDTSGTAQQKPTVSTLPHP